MKFPLGRRWRRNKSPRIKFGLAAIALTTLLSGCGAPLPHRNTGAFTAPPESTERQILQRSAGSRSVADAEERDLADLIRVALNDNPSLQQVIHEHAAALEQIPQVTALPEPRLDFRYYVNAIETRVGPQRYGVGITQPLPWFGKLQLQGVAASQAAMAAAERIGSVRNKVISDVASAWFELYYLAKSIAIVEANRDLLVNLEQVARTRYGTGSADHADIIRAQVELGKLEDQLARLNDKHAPLSARLNALLNRHVGAPVPDPEFLPIIPVAQSDHDVLQLIAENNPELKSIQFRTEAAIAQKQRAELDFFPDFAIGLDYVATDEARQATVRDSGQDALAARISVSLPIRRSKYSAGVREADAIIASNRAALDTAHTDLQAAAISGLFKLRDAERQIDLYRSVLIPKAEEALSATLSSYQTGTSSFADLVDAQRVLLAFELSSERATTDHNLARVSLEELAAQSLSTESSAGGDNNEQE